VGKNYFILLTTSSGFYRYNIHDLVKCVGFEGEAPILQFLNKGAHFSSITGEKLSEYQVVSAVNRAFHKMHLPVHDFTVAPVMDDDRPRYLLVLESDHSMSLDQQLAACAEQYLIELNQEYSDKRASGRLLPLTVQRVPPGTWVAFRHQRTAERGNLEEYKHPCLVNDLQFVDRLLNTVPSSI
jgi:hypothetical protein